MMLRISTPEQEGVYQGSKWLKFQVLCDPEELKNLFEICKPFFLFPLTGIVDGTPISEERFLREWSGWIGSLQAGRVPLDAELRSVLACAWTDDLDALWLQKIEGKGYLVKISKPVIQVQAHWFAYSDGAFRPMSMGSGSIFWGLQFSYPQIYQDAKTMELKETEKAPLFEKLRYWVRDTTRATPFLIDGQRKNATIRLGKRCFSWISLHPQLLVQKIGIVHG